MAVYNGIGFVEIQKEDEHINHIGLFGIFLRVDSLGLYGDQWCRKILLVTKPLNTWSSYEQCALDVLRDLKVFAVLN